MMSSGDAVLLLSMLLTGMLIGSSLTLFARGRIDALQRRRRRNSHDTAGDAKGAEDDDDDSGSDEDGGDDGDDDAAYGEELKMILVVNQGLSMSKGKMAAQCCHACLGAYKRASPAAIKAWSRRGQAKITVKAPDEATLRDVEAHARRAGVPCYLVADAGRTQIAAGSITVLGVGPAPASVLQPITGRFSLL